MILNVNFRYQASVVPKGKRNPVTRVYRGVVPVEVAELGEDEAPVALSFLEYGLGGERREVELRMAGDTLVRPFRASDGRIRSAGWIATQAAERYRTPSDDDPLSLSSHDHERSDVLQADDADVRSVTTSTEAARAAKVRERASRLVLVGGVLHEPSPEPVYRLMRGHPSPGGCPVRPVFPGVHSNESSKDVYRADEIDVLRSQHPHVHFEERDVIRVVNPEAIRADAPGNELVQAAVLALGALKAGLAEAGLDHFKAYMALRDALPLVETRDGTGPEVLLGPLKDAVEGGLLQDFYRERAVHAIERMDARALSQIDFAAPHP